jgi:hypothetical protein
MSLGSGLVQLERYVLREKEKVAFRVLKVVEPVKDLIEGYDGYIQRPTEGSLIQQSNSIPVTRPKRSIVLPHDFEDLP